MVVFLRHRWTGMDIHTKNVAIQLNLPVDVTRFPQIDERFESDNFINPALFGNREVMKLRKVNWNRILLVAILILLILEIATHLAFQRKYSETLPDSSSQHTFYLPAVPMQFVHENPDCTNKLLDAMNLTNVRIGNTS